MAPKTPPATKGSRPRRGPGANTLRRVVGAVLVVAASAGVWWVVDRTNHLEPYLITVHDVAAGAAVGEIDFEVAYLSAPGTTLHYLRPGDTDALATSVLDTALPAGSLVDHRMVGVAPPADTTTFTVELGIGGAPWLVPGARVEVWVAAPLEDQEFSVPLVTSPQAIVTGVRSDDGFAADASQVSVDLLVPRREIGALIHAQANNYNIQLSPSVVTQGSP
jgi:hypothetical protein